MAIEDDRRDISSANGLAGRLRGAWHALFGSPTIINSAVVARTAGQAVGTPQAHLIEQIIGGLPSAAIVLDREGRVVAFNEAATDIAPALSHGELALIGLRMPELVDAVRRAARRREPQRVEFFERVPLDRWMEAFVTPVRIGASGEPNVDLLLMTFNDLTPLRRVEEMRADFIANDSHEMRNQIAALLRFTGSFTQLV